jgi:hypothetical protein
MYETQSGKSRNIQTMAGVRALVLLALLGAASAFAPLASSGLKLRAAPRAVSKTP